jgi:hypothetical protein
LVEIRGHDEVTIDHGLEWSPRLVSLGDFTSLFDSRSGRIAADRQRTRIKLKGRDPRFDPKKHLSVIFQRGVIAGKAFATFGKGVMQLVPIETDTKKTPTQG